MNDLTTKRPKGLVPGTVDWLREIEGPRLVQRLIDEVHHQPVGEMTPTGARCASMLLDRALPTLSAVHHTIEGGLARMTDEEIKQELLRLTNQPSDTIDIQATEVRATISHPTGSMGEQA